MLRSADCTPAAQLSLSQMLLLCLTVTRCAPASCWSQCYRSTLLSTAWRGRIPYNDTMNNDCKALLCRCRAEHS